MIVLPCILGLIVVTVIITTSLAIIHRQRLINKLKIEAKEVAEKCVDQDAKGDVKIEQFERYFPKAYRTLADGTDESSTDSSDASGKANYDTHDKSLTVDVSPRVEADSITRHRPNRISAEWIQATDQILCFMRDKKKKLQIMHHLSTAIRDDNNYWSRVNINSISTHTTV